MLESRSRAAGDADIGTVETSLPTAAMRRERRAARPNTDLFAESPQNGFIARLRAERESDAPPTEDPVDAGAVETATADAPADPPVNLPFMAPLANTVWQPMPINEPYVPSIGFTDPVTKQRMGPQPFTTVLALSPPCARGKSTAFHGYMDKLLERKPGARILLLSANIMYGTSLSSELTKKYSDNPSGSVGFYRDVPNLADYNVVVCSLESLHHVDGQRFDATLIDEIRSIARLVGGGTMTGFNSIYLLKELCTTTPEIVVCDADLMFKVDNSEPETLAADFMKLIFGNRPVLHASLSHAGPAHLRRHVRMLFDFGGKKKNPGKKRWFAELEAAAAVWRQDHSKRFAVCVGTKAQLGEIYAFLTALKVPVKPYSGDTNEKSKFVDLKDPDSAWLEFGCVTATTSLSIGVDPKTIEFDRVFMWTNGQGCMLLAMLQASMRFGRQAAHPLGNQTISMLVKCIPPGERAKLVREGKKKPIVPPMFEDEYTRLIRRRGAAARMMAQELAVSGGRSLGIAPERHVADQILRVMAHSVFERNIQIDRDTTRPSCDAFSTTGGRSCPSRSPRRNRSPTRTLTAWQTSLWMRMTTLPSDSQTLRSVSWSCRRSSRTARSPSSTTATASWILTVARTRRRVPPNRPCRSGWSTPSSSSGPSDACRPLAPEVAGRARRSMTRTMLRQVAMRARQPSVEASPRLSRWSF